RAYRPAGVELLPPSYQALPLDAHSLVAVFCSLRSPWHKFAPLIEIPLFPHYSSIVSLFLSSTIGLIPHLSPRHALVPFPSRFFPTTEIIYSPAWPLFPL